MKLSLSFISFLLLLGCSIGLNAQGENNIWCFGDKRGINFNVNPPVFLTTQMTTIEGSAAVSDAAGNLLFYTSGADTWDRSGSLMPNGVGLLGNGPVLTGFPLAMGSSMTGVAIVKSPSNENQYYIIVTDAVEDQIYDAHYSVIDMTLNGGMGDVLPSKKNILLASGIAEGVITSRASNCEGYWAVLHRRLGSEYLAFKIDGNGVSTTPVLSNGIIGNNALFANYAMMRFNNSGDRIARGADLFETASFDRSTGIFSSFVTVQSSLMGGSIAFSPDDSKLYVGGNTGLVQFDLNLLPNVAGMQSGQYVVTNVTVSALRLAPNNKIYQFSNAAMNLSAVNNPNALGAACQFATNVMTVPTSTTISSYELGNPVVINTPINTVVPKSHDTTLCFQSDITLTAADGCISYMWNTGAITKQQTINQDGLYWVRSFKDCMLYVDTFHVTLVDFNVDLGADTNICKDAPLLLNATIAGDADYQWQDSSNENTFLVSEEGLYTVAVSKEGCVAKDSIHIKILEPYAYIAENDTLICKNRDFVLHATSFPEGSYQWSNGMAGASIPVNDSGLFVMTASNICGVFSDTVHITSMVCFCDAFMPNAFSPNGDGNNDVLLAQLNCPGMNDFSMRIFNRYGQRLFDSNEINRGWDGNDHGKPVDVGTYFYFIQYKADNGEVIKKRGDVIVMR